MRSFNGPKHQGGWVVLGAALVGVAGSLASQSKEDKANKVKYADQRDLDNLSFEQKDWLAQQQHAWELQDYQTAQNYKEDSVRGFAKYAPKNVASNDGSWGAPPERTDMSGQIDGLAQRDANGQPYIIDPRTGKPVFGADPAQGTLPQVA